MSNEDNVISVLSIPLLSLMILLTRLAVYLTSNEVTNKTCTIRPHWLNVNVTYIPGGFVTLEPTQNLYDISLTSSSLILAAVSTLDSHFAYSQTMLGNHILYTLSDIVSDLVPGASLSQFNKLLEEKMVRAHYTMAISY